MKISFINFKQNIKNNESEQQKSYAGYRLLAEEPKDSLEISFKGGVAKKMNELPVFIKKIVEDLKAAKTNGEVYKVFEKAGKENPDFKSIDPALYEYKGYRIQSALQMFSNELVKRLEFANSLKIDSAPKLVKHLKMGKDESVLITYLPGCENASPIPYSQYTKEIPQKAKNIFIKDMYKLAENGVIHTYGARGTASWMVNPKTEHIMLNNWESLQKVPDEAVSDGLKNIRSNLNI